MVSFTEGMEHVDFPEIVAGSLAELVGIEAAQEPFLGELPEDLPRRTLESNLPRKHSAAFRDFDLADLSRPVVHVAEKALVDSLQMR